MKRPSLAAAFVLMLTGITLFVTSCKDRDPTRGIVKVVSNGTPVIGAAVTVGCTEGNCTVVKNGNQKEVKGTTGGDGTVSFTFDLPGVLKITATHLTTDTSGSTVTHYGEGFIKLEEHDDVTQEVIIY